MHRLFSLLVFCLGLCSHSVLAAVLAVDYGSDWIKASLMAPGVPFDVLLNKDSKRKIQSSVGWKRQDRLFGGDAFNIAGRFPTDSFSSLKLLQGAPYSSPTTSFFNSISTADIFETTRGTVGARRADGSEWAVEELIAMQIAYVRDLAETSIGEKVSDIILTVPPFYTQHERDAVIDAVEIAGMKTLALINDGSAVAVNYAMTRTFVEKPEHHIIYDAGASSIRATIASFSTVDKKKNSGTQIQIAGVGFDRSTGGTELDRRLRELLIRDFEKKHKKDIRSDKRGMAKLWKESNRVKSILSANAEASSSVESLAYDIDFRTKVSRSEFESACRDMTGRFVKPISDALNNAGMTLDNITSVILTGGSSRTPMIQAAVKAAVGESRIALNVNADEAAVLGAALHGASLSRQFKTKDIRVTDLGPYDIQVSYQAESKLEGAKPRTINTLVFPAGSRAGSRKTLTFKRKEDFNLLLSYKSSPVLGYPTDILEAEITGIPEALKNLTDMGAVEPVVKATLVLSESGFVSVQDAVAFGEIKDDSIAGKLKGLFGGKDGSSSSEEAAGNTETVARSEASESNEPSGATTTTTASSTPTPSKKPTPKESTIALKVKVNLSSIPPMVVPEKRAARDRLVAIDREEAGKRRKEEARNSLEGYLYRVRDLLDDENQETPFKKCSQEKERQAILAKLEEGFEWLHEHGDDAKTQQYIDQRAAIENLEKPIIHRYKEIEEFPVALNASQLMNWSTRMFITEAKQNLTTEEAGGPPARFTQQEIADLEKTLKEHEAWMSVAVEKQKAVKMNEDPVLESRELKEKVKPLENMLQKLMKKRAPRPVKKSTTTSTTTSSTAAPTQTSAEGEDHASSKHDEL